MQLLILSIFSNEDELKFEELYMKYYDKLYKYAFHQLGSKDFAEEAVQNAFIKVLKKLEVYSSDDCKKTRGFLYMLIKWECKRQYKFISTQAKMEREYKEAVGPEHADDVWKTVEPRISIEIVKEILNNLPERDRDLYILGTVYGLTAKELAGLFKTTESNIYVKMHRIKKRIIDQWQQEVSTNG